MPHIPQSPTKDAGVLTFEDALAPRGGSYDREKWIYVPDFYSEYRYILGTRGKRPLVAIGINPSTAAPDDLDNTLKSVERIALGNGYDGFWMFNVYAQRATDPDAMERECNPVLHEENMKAFAYALENAAEEGVPDIWAAWGTIIEKRPYLVSCARDMAAIGERYEARWFTCGRRSKAGHPHHPLYLAKNARLEPFDPAAYFASF